MALFQIGYLALDQKENTSQDLAILEDLRATLMKATEKNIDESHKKQLKIILKQLWKIKSEHPIKDEIVESLPQEINLSILSKLEPFNAKQIGVVNKSWNSISDLAFFDAINQKQTPLKQAFNTKVLEVFL